MAKKRIIPKLQFLPSRHVGENISLVTTVQFEKIIEMGNPVSQAKIFEAQMADELIFIDISIYKNRASKTLALEVLKEAAKRIFLPLTIGGGVSTVEDIRLFLNHGADKVCITTQALESPDLIVNSSGVFGASTIVVGIDYKQDEDGGKYVYSHGGQKKWNIDPVTWAMKVEDMGAGEILLTSISRDGTRSGLDIDTIRAVTDKVSIPVIASGGCGLASHFSEGFLDGHCSAVASGTFFCFQDQNIMQTRSQVKNSGVDVRLRT